MMTNDTSPKGQRDLRGERFGRLIVIGPAAIPRRWICHCDCGTITGPIFAGNLTRLRTTSCGCWHREAVSISATTHGLSRTKEHVCWCEIKRRCYNSKSKSFPDYGRRGIRMCMRWLASFEAFLADVGNAPGPEFTIDRVNVDGHYSCGTCKECRENNWQANCRWATRQQQLTENRSDILTVTHDNKTKRLKEWARELGISYHTLFNRIFKQNMSVTDAFSKPTTVRLYEHDGQHLTLKQWSEKTGIGYQTLMFRLKHGWTFSLAVSTPAKIGQKVLRSTVG